MDQPAPFIRYAESIQLIFKMRNSNGQIYPPYMKIKYGTTASNAASVSFGTVYEMDTSEITKNIKVWPGFIYSKSTLQSPIGGGGIGCILRHLLQNHALFIVLFS